MKTALGEQRMLYSSPNGDRWLLGRDPATGDVFIRHEANVPSGEHQALLRLIGALVETKPGAARH